MRLLLLFSLLDMASLAANQVQRPDGMPGHKTLLQRQDSASLLYETETVLYVDFIPALSTSTVYQTTDITITGCLPSVSSCPYVSTTFVTATTAVYTTLCPITLTSMRVGRMTVPMATSIPSTANTSVATTPGSSSTPSTNVAYTTSNTSGSPFAHSAVPSTPSSFNASSSWPATIFSTHSSTILLGASSETSVYPTASTIPTSFNSSSSGPILSTLFAVSSTSLAYPTASVTASPFNGSVVTNSSILTTFVGLSTSLEVLTTLACNSTCYSSVAASIKSASFRMPLPIGLSTRAVATYWNATTSTTGGSLVVPTSSLPSNGTPLLTVFGGSSVLSFSSFPSNSSANFTALSSPVNTTASVTATAVPTPVNATAALTTGSIPSGVFGSSAVVPGNGVTNLTGSSDSSATAVNAGSTGANNSFTSLHEGASPARLNATMTSSDTSQSLVLTSSTLAWPSSSGNISSIALKPTVQPFFSGAESETTSGLVFGLVALVYLVILMEL